MLAVAAGSREAAPGTSGTASSTPRSSLSPSPSLTPGGFTPSPTASRSAEPVGPVATPSGTASPGTEASPVPLSATAQPVAKVDVSLGKLTAVTGKATGVGEIDGPAIRFSVTFRNGTAKAIPLSSVVVDVSSGRSETPAAELMSVRTPLPDALGAGKSATGTYTFSLAKADRDGVRITVDYYVGVPIVVFSGDAPR